MHVSKKLAFASETLRNIAFVMFIQGRAGTTTGHRL